MDHTHKRSRVRRILKFLYVDCCKPAPRARPNVHPGPLHDAIIVVVTLVLGVLHVLS